MENQKVYAMALKKVYPLLVQKAERKGRTQTEIKELISWLTGYDLTTLEKLVCSDISYGDFFSQAPKLHPDRFLIKGSICGVRVESITESPMREIRILDKLVDDLAKGKPMDKILPKSNTPS